MARGGGGRGEIGSAIFSVHNVWVMQLAFFGESSLITPTCYREWIIYIIRCEMIEWKEGRKYDSDEYTFFFFFRRKNALYILGNFTVFYSFALSHCAIWVYLKIIRNLYHFVCTSGLYLLLSVFTFLKKYYVWIFMKHGRVDFFTHMTLSYEAYISRVKLILKIYLIDFQIWSRSGISVYIYGYTIIKRQWYSFR